jgi:hypothetical protein
MNKELACGDRSGTSRFSVVHLVDAPGAAQPPDVQQKEDKVPHCRRLKMPLIAHVTNTSAFEAAGRQARHNVPIECQ